MTLRGSSCGILVGAALLIAMPALAGTSGTYRGNEAAWSRDDKCAREAFGKFPDFTREALAKREQFVRRCEIAAGVPYRQSFIPAADGR